VTAVCIHAVCIHAVCIHAVCIHAVCIHAVCIHAVCIHAVCIHALVLYKHFFTNTSLPLRRSELSRWRHNWKSAQVVNSQPSV